ncbi:MAG: hypothetical protein KA218_03795 [Arenimonas sp.]|nr:hypothetical protein [Arenimonas sp.]MBP7981802.1 hypothetical protein [Arenimonas sp.]
MIRHFMSIKAMLAIALLFVAGQTRADELDVVLDVMHKAGVIDGNVVAAKPLIFCLADGKSVEACTIDAAGDSELAEDPQVRNVLDIYLAFRAEDYTTVIKKAGVTVGCALIPGGEVKDIVCGELGKIALSIAEGVGGELISVGKTIYCGILGGCSDDKPPPMAAEDFYRLYLAPGYHRLLMAKEAEDGSYKTLSAPLFQYCQNFYATNYDSDNGACFVNSIKLDKTVGALHQALKNEGHSYYALRVEPKLEDWAFAHFGQDSSAWVQQEKAQCRIDTAKAIPLPSAYTRCDYMAKQNAAMKDSVYFGAHYNNILAQCKAESASWDILPPNDIYAMACEPIAQKTPSAVLGAMNLWKQRMDKAAAAGCGNSGTPASISCPTFDTLLACLKALPDKRSACEADAGRKQTLLAQGVLEQLYTPSAKAGKPQRCVRLEDTVQCNRPVKQQQCETFFALYGDNFKTPGVPKIGQPKARCTLQSDAAFDAQVRQAKDAVALLNGGAPAAITRSDSVTAPSRVQASALWKMAEALSRPAGACRVEAPDWLRIRCGSGFVWNADETRAQAVRNLLGGDLALCPADMELDGADLPCLDGVAVGAFPSKAEPAPTEPQAAPILLKIDPAIYRKVRPVAPPVEPDPKP